MVPPLNAYEKGRQYRVERFNYIHVGPLYRSFANVVRDEGPRRGGLVLVGRWARAVVCEYSVDCGKWAEVGRAVARSLGKKGVATIVPFSGGKGVFFVETIEKALFLHDLRFIKIEGGNSVQLRRWSPKENSMVEGKFRGGWIELRGVPFHLWSEVHLKKLVEQWGTVTEIDWRTLKLFDLNKVRVRIAMKDRTILPTLIEVIDGDWVFTISVAVVGGEEIRRGRVMGESTREGFESHSGTGGGRREEKDRSTAQGSFRVGETSRKKKEEERCSTEVLLAGTRGKNGQCMGNNSLSLNSKNLNYGPVGIEMAGEASTDEDEAFSCQNGRASERKAQSLSNFSPIAKTGCLLKGPMRMGLGTEEKKPVGKLGSLQNEGGSTRGKEKGERGKELQLSLMFRREDPRRRK